MWANDIPICRVCLVLETLRNIYVIHELGVVSLPQSNMKAGIPLPLCKSLVRRNLPYSYFDVVAISHLHRGRFKISISLRRIVTSTIVNGGKRRYVSFDLNLHRCGRAIAVEGYPNRGTHQTKLCQIVIALIVKRVNICIRLSPISFIGDSLMTASVAFTMTASAYLTAAVQRCLDSFYIAQSLSLSLLPSLACLLRFARRKWTPGLCFDASWKNIAIAFCKPRFLTCFLILIDIFLLYRTDSLHTFIIACRYIYALIYFLWLLKYCWCSIITYSTTYRSK